jgi:hypothetical protein
MRQHGKSAQFGRWRKDNVVMTSSRKNDGATGYGKDAKRKSRTPDFPSPLGNPANPAGFPLSHSPDDDYGSVPKTGPSTSYRKGDISIVVRRGTVLLSVDILQYQRLTIFGIGAKVAN